MSNSLPIEKNVKERNDEQRLVNIGKKARDLDQKSIKERMKIDKSAAIRIIIALIVYILIMTLFYFFL